MSEIPKPGEPGSASFYGTEQTLDAVLERYKIHPGSSDFYVKTKKALLEKVAAVARDGDTVLDIGCSFGLVTCEMAKIYQGKGLNARLIGIDLKPTQIDNAREYAKQQGMENAEFQVCDAFDLIVNRRGEKYNLITSLYGFHHIPDAKQDGSGTDRQLNPGKGGVLNDYNAEKRKLLKILYFMAFQRASLVIGDIFTPEPFSNRAAYLEAVETSWKPPRIQAAREVSQEAKDMEDNAVMGVLARTNEYPVTLEELTNLLDLAAWDIKSEEVIQPYGDAVLHCIKR